MAANILVVEDNKQVAEALIHNLRRAGYVVKVCNDGASAISELKKTPYHLVIIDLLLPFTSGIKVIKYAKTEFPLLPVIVLSSVVDENVVTRTFLLGVQDYITKPYQPTHLLQCVEKRLKQAS